MKPFFFLVLAGWISAAPQATAQVRQLIPLEVRPPPSARIYPHWTVFQHPAYGYELPVPPGVRAVGIPETSAEVTFVSADRDFVMTAWGGLSRQSPIPHFEAEWRLARSKPGRSINYQRKARSWFVVSGTDAEGMEFYEKFTMRGNHVAGFALSYPRARLREFDPWVVAIEKGFRLVTVPGGPQIASRAPARPDRVRVDQEDRSLESRSTDQPPTPRRETSRERVDVTPRESFSNDRSATRDAPIEREKESTAREEPKREPEKQDRPSSASDKEYPYGEKVPGKEGFVYSPFSSGKRLVDVEDYPSGSLVKCPYTMKIFRVP